MAHYETPGVIGDAAQIPGVDTDVAIEDVTIEEEEVNMVLPNDLGINPTPAHEPSNVIANEPSNVIEYDKADDTADNTAESNPEPVVTPTPIKSQRPSRNRKQVKTYVPSMKGKAYQYSNRGNGNSATSCGINHDTIDTKGSDQDVG
jgi:hypothetical protein